MGLSGLFGLKKAQNGQALPVGLTAPPPSSTSTVKPAVNVNAPLYTQLASGAAAMAAAAKARKKATGGTESSTPTPTGSILAPAANMAPKSLLGF